MRSPFVSIAPREDVAGDPQALASPEYREGYTEHKADEGAADREPPDLGTHQCEKPSQGDHTQSTDSRNRSTTKVYAVDSNGRRNTSTVRSCDGNTETSSVTPCGTSSDAVAGSSHGGTP